MRFKVAAPLLSALVAACGGGGGGAAPAAPPAVTPYTLTFTPNPLAATAISGTSLAVNVDVQVDHAIPETVNLAVIDRQGVLLPNLTLVALSATRLHGDDVHESGSRGQHAHGKLRVLLRDRQGRRVRRGP